VAESDLTHNRNTHYKERLARWLKLRELDIAGTVLQLSSEAEQEADCGPAYWLISGGRADLIRALGGHFAAGDGRRWARLLRRLRGPIYAAFPIVGAILPLLVLFERNREA
jgi:hypothetical protein